MWDFYLITERVQYVVGHILTISEKLIGLIGLIGKSELPSVLIVCGDHGMRDNGGHGGSSTGEVVVPLFVYFKNNKCGGSIKYVQ